MANTTINQSSGDFVGTRAQYNTAKNAGQIPAGSTVYITDDIYVEAGRAQTLTSAQKAQARSNIGIDSTGGGSLYMHKVEITDYNTSGAMYTIELLSPNQTPYYEVSHITNAITDGTAFFGRIIGNLGGNDCIGFLLGNIIYVYDTAMSIQTAYDLVSNSSTPVNDNVIQFV